ncbi:breast carcinoma amplified sequence 2 [Hysterangium stoloniferum]|nr:breast carcinoma amplified sequence 2 [Hysterangium stoloniferum]
MSTESEAFTELLDSLPYYDNDLDVHPQLRRKVEAELARVPKPIPGVLHPKVSPPISLFQNHPLLAAELERVESHQPIPLLDTVRYQLPAPSTQDPSEEAWSNAVQNAKAQLEHQSIRHTNLSLLQSYGPNAWKINNYLLEASAVRLEKTVEDLKQRTVEVNRERKNAQASTRTGAQLTSLETRWTELISNVLQIELANVALELENAQLAQKERELAELLIAYEATSVGS